MGAKLIKSVSKPMVNNPYVFMKTGVSCYCLEEILYHIQQDFENSVEDYLSGKICTWIHKEAGLTEFYQRIKNVLENDSTISEKFKVFIDYIPFLDDIEAKNLKTKIYNWENKDKWQKNKEKGDYALANGEYKKAYAFYKKSLEFSVMPQTLNNLGICQKYLYEFENAEKSFEQALALDGNNNEIVINLFNLLMLTEKFDYAHRLLLENEKTFKDDLIYIYLGDLNLKLQKNESARKYYEKALDGDYIKRAYKGISFSYLNEQKLDIAISSISGLKKSLPEHYYYLLAKIYEKCEYFGEAVRNIEFAIFNYNSNLNYWVYYAKLCLKKGDLMKANGAALRAIQLDGSDKSAKYIFLKIKKKLLKFTDYEKGVMAMLGEYADLYCK